MALTLNDFIARLQDMAPEFGHMPVVLLTEDFRGEGDFIALDQHMDGSEDNERWVCGAGDDCEVC